MYGAHRVHCLDRRNQHLQPDIDEADAGKRNRRFAPQHDALAERTIEEIGRRIITVFLGVWESPDGQQRMKGLLRSVVTSEEVSRLVREGLLQMIIEPVSAVLGVPDARLRVSLVASQLLGVALARYLVELEPLATATPAEVIDRIAPVLQHHLTA